MSQEMCVSDCSHISQDESKSKQGVFHQFLAQGIAIQI